MVRQGDRYVRHLTAADFVLLEEGREVAIDSLEPGVCSLAVSILIDVSDSMSRRLGRVQESACRFIERLAPEDQVSVWGFSHLLYKIGEPTSDRALAQSFVRQLPSGGGTYLYDALDMVLDQGLSPLERNVVVVFTDGVDGTRSLASRIARKARERGVIVYPLYLIDPEVKLEARRGIGQIARWSGGEALPVPALDRLDATFDAILDDLRAQYRLSFTPSPGPAGVRRIELRTRNPRHEVRCRDHYRWDG